MESLRQGYGIVAALAEGVAPQDAPQCEGTALEGAVKLDSLDGVLRAGWGEATGGCRLQGGKGALIESDEFNQQTFHRHSPVQRAGPPPSDDGG